MPAERSTAVQRLVEAGVVTPARTSKRPSEEPVAITGKVSDLVVDQRR